jgi:hypothetical protein
MTRCELDVRDPDYRELIPASVPERYDDRIIWTAKKVDKMDYTLENKWDEYVDSLTEWEQNLVNQTTIIGTISEIIECILSSDTVLHCASDGSATTTSGTYGWVIAQNDYHLVSGYGHVPGFPRTSMRSEACGKLAWVTWLLHFTKFYNIEIQCTILSYCNNKTVVAKSMRRLFKSYVYHNSKL